MPRGRLFSQGDATKRAYERYSALPAPLFSALDG
jgi:hypothetical protein